MVRKDVCRVVWEDSGDEPLPTRLEKYKQEVVPNYILDQAVRLHGHTAHILIEGMLVPGIKIISWQNRSPAPSRLI